jgi:hypothetical protein
LARRRLPRKGWHGACPPKFRVQGIFDFGFLIAIGEAAAVFQSHIENPKFLNSNLFEGES